MTLRRIFLHSQRCIVIMLLVLLTGCGAVKFAYDYADWWVEFKIEQWVDLTAEQEDSLQAGLDPYFIWHKQTVIPQAQEALKALVQAAQKGQCAQAFGSQQNLWKHLYYETIENITPIIARVLMTLSKEQITEFQNGLNEDLEEVKNKAKEPDKKIKKFLDRMDSILGGLTPEQTAQLTVRNPSWQTHDALQIQCRQDHQKRLINLLQGESSLIALQTILDKWWTQRGCSPEFIKQRDEMRMSRRAKMAQFETTLSPDQRNSLVQELTQLHDNLLAITR